RCAAFTRCRRDHAALSQHGAYHYRRRNRVRARNDGECGQVSLLVDVRRVGRREAMTVLGLHHITLVCADAQRTVDFYTGVLGLRLVKQTVNFDDPGSYHLYFGDGLGRPGTAITFFEWPRAPRGRPGVGGTHHFALAVADDDSLLKWKRRLTDLGLAVSGPLDRHYFTSIYF